MIANAYRLFGHDVELTHGVTRDVKYTYAAAHSCVVESYAVYQDHDRNNYWTPTDNEEREGRHYPVPPLMDVMREGHITLMILRPTIKFADYMSHKSELRPKVVFVKPSSGRTFNVRSTLAKRPVTLLGNSHLRTEVADFQKHELDPPPMRPEGTRTATLADIMPLEHGADNVVLITNQ